MAQQTPDEIRSLPDPPSDGITSLTYLPCNTSLSLNKSLLMSSSWDGSIRIHDTISMTHLCTNAMDSGPILSTAAPRNEKYIITGGLDGTVKKFDIETSTTLIIGRHSPDIESPLEDSIACSCVSALNAKHSPSSSLVASAGWDSNFYLWDVRSASTSPKGHKPLYTIKLPGKAFSIDVDQSLGTRFLCATAGRRLCIIDARMNKSEAPFVSDVKMVMDRESSLKYQTRVARFLPDGSGLAIGSIEGRVALEFLDELGVDSRGMKKYAFKCHRVGDTVYPVNAIAFNNKYGTFATGGCDGTVVTWDGLNKKKITTLPKFATSISALAFKHDGSELAIASSYTFEDGERDHPRDEIFVRSMADSDIRPKSSS